MKKKPKGQRPPQGAPELNIMPFIDIFSMLNTFLLVSAAFVGLGVIEVQVPFLSNAPEVQEEKPTRSLSIRVDVEEAQILLTTQWTEEPVEKSESTYELNEQGIESFHQDLMKLRQSEPDADKVTAYIDDTVKYEKVVLVLDAIKTLKETDPPLNLPPKEGESLVEDQKQRYLYEKVVIGSVLL